MINKYYKLKTYWANKVVCKISILTNLNIINLKNKF